MAVEVVPSRIPLKAPFPYFGGKRPVAELVWSRLGDVRNYIEPFYGSGAVHLLRPHEPKVETVNDLDCYLANFWRSVKADAAAVVEHCDWPVNETDLHARHRYLVLSEDSVEFRRRMRTEPDYFDARVAGWWVWGQCMWIGSGWCSVGANDTPEPIWEGRGSAISNRNGRGVHIKQKGPLVNGAGGCPGVHQRGNGETRPQLTDGTGRGVHAKRPMLRGSGFGGSSLNGVHQQLPDLSGDRGAVGRGVHASGGPREGRPQIADAFSRGRGVHSNDSASSVEQRRAWLLDWFGRLQDRFRATRVCCGHWLRVCESTSVTTRIGLTGVLLDPPYKHAVEEDDGGADAGALFGVSFSGKKKNRDPKLYGHDSATVADEVREWCISRGPDPKMRIALCGLEGEHDELERLGWTVEAWKSNGGYGNRTKAKEGNANKHRERIWFSPHCLQPENCQ